MSVRESNFFGPYSFTSKRCIGCPDATVNKILRERFHNAKNLFRKDLSAHFGCVNAIEFSHNGGEWICTGGDDRRVLLWNAQKATTGNQKPFCMKGEHHSNIFCIAFNNNNGKVFSGGNDEQVIVHDIKTGESVDVFNHEEAVYGLSVDPVNENVFASACDDGRILIYDLRAPPDEDPLCLANYPACPMHAVMFNPVEPRLVVTANSREGLGLWDARKPRKCVVRYGGSLARQSCMSVRINGTGDKVIGLRRRLPPVLFDLNSPHTVHQFDHSGYYNSCTMKSCCFAGDKDQYIISGSDDFNLYVWKIPEEGCTDWVDKAHLILRGHRSIVNQVRFNPANHMIISSGVEKVVKVWSPFPLQNGSGDLGLDAGENERSVYTHEEYIDLVLRSGQLMTHDYTTENTDEDPRMMAFFDSLVQRELECWSSEDSFDSSSPITNSYVNSDNSRASSPDVTATDQIESVAANAVLRLFSPFNALTNRSAWSNVGGTLRNQLHVSSASGGTNHTDPVQQNPAEPSGTDVLEREAVLFDMDSQAPGVVTEGNSVPVTDIINSEASESSRSDRTATTISTSATNRTNTIDPVEVTDGNPPVSLADVQASTSQDSADSNANNEQSVRSISQLILQKRDEYLAGITKFHQRAEKRNQAMVARRKEKLKRVKMRLLPKKASNGKKNVTDADAKGIESSDSLSDSDDSISSDSSSVSEKSEDHDASTSGKVAIEEIIANRKRLLSRITQFSNLRQRALNSDSCDSGEDEIKKMRSSANQEIGRFSKVSCPPVYEDISSDSCHVEATTGVVGNTSAEKLNQVSSEEGPSFPTNGFLSSISDQRVNFQSNINPSTSSNSNIISVSNGHSIKSLSSNGDLHLQNNGSKLHTGCNNDSHGATNCDFDSCRVDETDSGVTFTEELNTCTNDNCNQSHRNDNGSLFQDDNKESTETISDSIFKKLKMGKKKTRNYRKHDSNNVD